MSFAHSTPAEALPQPAESSVDARQLEILRHEPRNLLALAFHFILIRVAWVFKTETVIMPAFLDIIAGSGWIRGCLPLLNRVGQSVPPILLSDRLRARPLKNPTLLITTSLMSVPFFLLSGLWAVYWTNPPGWLPVVFLACYFWFFACNGLNQMVFGTLQGKLIRPDRRGRLMSLSGILGSLIAVTCAWFLMQRWLQLPDGGYTRVFGVTAVGFILAGLCSFAISEPRDENPPAHRSARHLVCSSWQVFCHDRHFRQTGVVDMLFIYIQLLFPQYQALGRESLKPDEVGFHLMLWVIAQNVSVGLFSMVMGTLADRYGNRVVLRSELAVLCLTPLFAIWLTSRHPEYTRNWYWMVYFMLGLTPVTMRTLVNYTLELTRPDNHPQYVSTMGVCLAVPLLFAPLAGWLIEAVGFPVVFCGIAGLIGLGVLLTFRLAEPRFTSELAPIALPSDEEPS